MGRINMWKSWLVKICTVLFLFSILGCQAINLTAPSESPKTNTAVSNQESPVKLLSF